MSQHSLQMRRQLRCPHPRCVPAAAWLLAGAQVTPAAPPHPTPTVPPPPSPPVPTHPRSSQPPHG